MAQQKGVAIGLITAGAVSLYAGLKGYSIPTTIQSIVQGKTPQTQTQVTGIATPTGSPTAGIPGGVSSLGSGTGSAIASDALRYKGAGYTWDGSPANGIGQWDCSSFANWVIGHDMRLAIPFYGAGKYTGSSHGPPTDAWVAWGGCTTIGHDGNVAQPGDIAVWVTLPTGHMGICTGPNEMISAQSTSSGTQVAKINGFDSGILYIRRLRAVTGK